MSPAAAKKKAPKPPRPQPFLKWAGGKRQLLPKILPHVPETFERYHEPFLGAGALFFALADAGRLRRGAYLGDINERLIRTWKALQNEVDAVVSTLNAYEAGYRAAGEERRRYFELQRERPDIDQHSDVAVAAWMIFLNKTCFNGIYRVNREGKFNVPHGRHKNPTICDAETLRQAADTLNYKTMIYQGDYQQTVTRAQPGDFVYFDPPYAPVSDTADFTSYTADKFNDKNQEQLRDAALTLKQKGVHVLISNSSAPIIKKLYETDFEIVEVEAKRAVNSKGGKRGPVVEYLIK